MLQLRPSCENCDRELPPESDLAMICSYECTFCRTCVDQILRNVCPNCGGGFCLRPVRPHRNLINGNNLGNHPALNKKIFKPVDVDAHNAFAKDIVSIPPNDR